MKRKLQLFSLFVLCMIGVATYSNAQTLKHSYTFEAGTYDIAAKTINDQVGTAHAAINGLGIILENGSVKNTYGSRGTNGYISFDGAALALNTYTALTLEYYVTTCNIGNQWAVLSYFGGDNGATSFCTNVITSGGKSRAILNGAGAASAEASRLEPNTTHHCVAVLTPSTATVAGSIVWYIDGVAAATKALLTTDATHIAAISALASKNAFLFRSGWNDNNWSGTVHEFNIYDGAMDAATVATRNSVYKGNQLSALTVNTGTLKPTFTSGIFNYALTLPDGTTSLTVDADSSLTGRKIKGTGTFDVSGNSGTIKVNIDTTADAVPYTIYWSKPIASAELIHSYTFADNTAKDVKGGADGTLVGTKNKIANGAYIATGNGNLTAGTSSHIVLPGKAIALNQYPSFTMETYVLATANNFISFFGGQHIWAIDYLFMQHNATDLSCNAYSNPWSGTTSTSATVLGSNTNGVGHHLVTVVANDTMYTYRDGVFSAKKVLGSTNKYFNLKNDTAYLGRSGYVGDASMIGTINEYNIYKGALDTATIRTRAAAYRAADAFLTGMTISKGTLKPAFNTVDTTFTAALPFGTTSLLLAAVPSNALATIADTGTVSFSGSAVRKVVVTAPDGITKTSRTINFRYVSIDSTLSDLTVGGTTVAGFAPNVYTYNVLLPTGTSVAPVVVGKTAFIEASAVITNATAIPGSTKVVVTAENGTSKLTYTINFTLPDPTIVAIPTYLTFDELNTSGTFSVNGGGLTDSIRFTLPTGYTVSPKALGPNASNEVVTVTFNGLAESIGKIILSSGTAKDTVRVIGTLNSTKFTPAFATGNLITDPYFNSLSTYAGWGGGKVITTDTTEVYSGSRSLKMTGDCGASVDFALNGKIKTNSKYRLRVMAKTSGTGKYKVMVNGFNVVAGVDNFIVDLNTGGAWKQIDTTFTSGSTLLANQNLFINSCEGYGGTLAIIDNYELYLIPATDANLSDLKVNGTTATGFAAGTITYNVVLPFGTTAIPVVAATVNEPNATTVITQAASVNGSATVEVTAQDGTTKKTYTINFSVSTVGNPTIADNSFVSVKPTISSSDFMVEFAGKLGKISVIDSRGRLVSSKVASNSTEVISVPSAGIYTIQINVNGAIKTVKVVKTK